MSAPNTEPPPSAEPASVAVENDPEATDTRFTWESVTRKRRDKPLRELPGVTNDALRLVWQAAPRELTVIAVINVIMGVLSAVQLLFIRNLLQAFAGVDSGGRTRDVFPDLVGFLVVYTLIAVLQLSQEELRRVMSELVTRYAQTQVARAAAEADLVDYERPGFHDLLQRAMANAGSRPVQVTYALITMGSSLATATGVAVALAFVEPLLLALLVVAFGPLWILARQVSRLSYAFDVELTEADRRRGYLWALLTLKKPAKEVRAFGLVDFFLDRHSVLWDDRLVQLRKVARRRMRLGVVARLVNSVLLGGVILMLVWLLSSGRLSLSDTAVAAGAIVLLGQRLSAVMTGVGQLYECSLFLHDVNAFLDVAAQRRALPSGDAPTAPLELLEADEVTFCYPASSEPALRGVSVTVRPGEVVALVGANGSGKTTLAKVLAQLYHPDTGQVRWNGVDAATLDTSALRDQIAVIFQDFEQYLFTGAENIGLGRVERLDDRRAVIEAAYRSGASEFLGDLAAGYDSLLGPEFYGGSDLSIGQWQRVAIARAFFRDAELVILDEPSSALDPVAEAALFDRLRDLCTDRAVIVVSHRFSTVMSASRIYVLDHGRVIESGSHSELMALGGMYARMFRLQAAQYLEVD